MAFYLSLTTAPLFHPPLAMRAWNEVFGSSFHSRMARGRWSTGAVVRACVSASCAPPSNNPICYELGRCVSTFGLRTSCDFALRVTSHFVWLRTSCETSYLDSSSFSFLSNIIFGVGCFFVCVEKWKNGFFHFRRLPLPLSLLRGD